MRKNRNVITRKIGIYMNAQHLSLFNIFVDDYRNIPYIENIFLFFIKFSTNMANSTSKMMPSGILAEGTESYMKKQIMRAKKRIIPP